MEKKFKFLILTLILAVVIIKTTTHKINDFLLQSKPDIADIISSQFSDIIDEKCSAALGEIDFNIIGNLVLKNLSVQCNSATIRFTKIILSINLFKLSLLKRSPLNAEIYIEKNSTETSAKLNVGNLLDFESYRVTEGLIKINQEFMKTFLNYFITSKELNHEIKSVNFILDYALLKYEFGNSFESKLHLKFKNLNFQLTHQDRSKSLYFTRGLLNLIFSNGTLKALQPTELITTQNGSLQFYSTPSEWQVTNKGADREILSLAILLECPSKVWTLHNKKRVNFLYFKFKKEQIICRVN